MKNNESNLSREKITALFEENLGKIQNVLCESKYDMQIAANLTIKAPVHSSFAKKNKTDYSIPGGNLQSAISIYDVINAWKEKLISTVFTTNPASADDKICISEEEYKIMMTDLLSGSLMTRGYDEGINEAYACMDGYKEYSIEDVKKIAANLKEESENFMSQKYGDEYKDEYRIAKAVALMDASDIYSEVAAILEAKRDKANSKGKAVRQTER